MIKELALSKLKSKGTLNMLDSVPNAADPFVHTPGAYNASWKAQSDTVTYKVDLGSTNVLVPYGTGTASSDYTAITNASNGLMVLPQETVLGAFSGSTPEYGTVAEIDGSLPDATYLYATVAEVDYLTNDTVNTRQVVFRLHDPTNKAQGIVFEAGKQYTFLLTLGLDGAEIVFSIPTVTPFNESAVVDLPEPTPWKCGDLINGYTTANYSNATLSNFCWTTQNIAEGTATYDTYGGTATPTPSKGERGFYYTHTEGDAACKTLGPEWALPSVTLWLQFNTDFYVLVATVSPPGAPQTPWIDPTTMGGFYDSSAVNWNDWGAKNKFWCYDDPWVAVFDAAANIAGFSTTVDPADGLSVRCVRTMP